MQRERMIKNVVAVTAIACAFLLGASPFAFADDDKKGEGVHKEVAGHDNDKKAEHKNITLTTKKSFAKLTPKTPPGQWHTVKAEPFKVQTTINSTIEAIESTAVKIKTKQWTALKVVDAVAQGKSVEKGQTLIQLDTEKIDEAIVDATLALHGAELAYERATLELKALETTTPMDLAAAEEKYNRAEEDLDRYLKTERPYAFKSNDQYLENAMYSLMSTQEELNQLRKMYEEDDLTEETEEIILKRQIHSVKRAELSYESAENRHQQILNSTYPRQLEDRKVSLRKSQLDIKRSRVTIPIALQLKKIDHEKQKLSLAKTEKKLAELKQDRKLLTVRAPVGGMVYFGSFNEGSWSGAAQMQAVLKPDGIIKPNVTILTIVQPRPVRLRGNITEANLHKVSKGMAGLAFPTATPANAYSARIKSVTTLPTTPGQYTALAELDLPESANRILPGMTAKLTITAQKFNEAFTVPTSAVHRDDNGKPYVKLLGANNKIILKPVQLGLTVANKTRICSGIKAGDKVQTSTQAPAAKK